MAKKKANQTFKNNKNKLIFLALIFLPLALLSFRLYTIYSYKTYTNFKYGYQLKVPREWHIYSAIREGLSQKCIEGYQLADEIRIFKEPTDKCGELEQPAFSIVSGGSPLPDIDFANGGRIQKKLTIDGVRAYEDDFTDDHSVVAIKLNNDNKGYSIMAQTNYNYQKVLSSIHFLSKEDLDKLPFPTPLPAKFTKRFFKLNGKIVNFANYPTQITHVDGQNLIGMDCRGTYGSDAGPYQTDINSDPTLKALEYQFDKIENLPFAKYISFCNLEDGRVLATFYTYPGGIGDSHATAHFGILENGKLTIFLNYDPGMEAGRPAIGFGPLELTKNNILYYARDTGDAISVVEIHKVDFNQKTHKIILTCRGDYYVENGKDVPNPSCY